MQWDFNSCFEKSCRGSVNREIHKIMACQFTQPMSNFGIG